MTDDDDDGKLQRVCVRLGCARTTVLLSRTRWCDDAVVNEWKTVEIYHTATAVVERNANTTERKKTNTKTLVPGETAADRVRTALDAVCERTLRYVVSRRRHTDSRALEIWPHPSGRQPDAHGKITQ